MHDMNKCIDSECKYCEIGIISAKITKLIGKKHRHTHTFRDKHTPSSLFTQFGLKMFQLGISNVQIDKGIMTYEEIANA